MVYRHVIATTRLTSHTNLNGCKYSCMIIIILSDIGEREREREGERGREGGGGDRHRTNFMGDLFNETVFLCSNRHRFSALVFKQTMNHFPGSCMLLFDCLTAPTDSQCQQNHTYTRTSNHIYVWSLIVPPERVMNRLAAKCFFVVIGKVPL